MISRAPCSLPGLAISSLALAIAFPAYGQSRRSSEIVVTAPGGDIHLDRAEGLAAVEIEASGPPSVFEALTRSIPGISLQDAQSNPFQPNLVYHGFTISPLQGHAQGLAVYVDGARFNQPFGDTVQFDLLPDAAIERLDLLPASPVYGLNALGGALAIETKTGRSAPGFSGAAALGAYGETEITTEIGDREARGAAISRSSISVTTGGGGFRLQASRTASLTSAGTAARGACMSSWRPRAQG